ncbi:hypothetical protein ACFQFC_03205 [Amorphoplanes digitatis]|uniref:YCII-related domain-containing protein n=1 Tax=Actinoplanes digitatis TaxID=1868 RepID=A0A7W7HYL8_9ACTN|nr:hypothetical protein [Actinoplanes digitatis]MBB4763184.1 hypothetical protein [Actinoplanes digitatis]BFE72213.1 YciI family protein [Actinoplanes digitatis]GID92002.1 hypothetical protein Adi01nite_14140 [Actinoplanes digitatis]
MTKFLLIQHHVAMGTWTPADIRRHYDYQTSLDAELAAAGELVETQGLAGLARLVTGDGVAAAGGMPVLAGYRIVDVESQERALGIAARAAAAPGPGGAPLCQPIDVRQLLTP